ncbi:single-stranded DNA-binding protein [Frigoribacterium sp. VKM Ac-2836]|uniref:single-stranded DNA-binding protein n=1 Tax=Frigoribacterium sp. VKM Ac-2836 TaxID=2739014 RepID=UPI001566C214|nr:single-stranded DNA-binding protein [Frigoribacterium sp. VKM Ac-2836]NRD27456.1 single-stranded DNA-binding protein [Frigoribacterium sp. VKM Ac-2836]
MTDTITLTGIIATDPRALVTQTGLSITSFRLASTQRRYDRVTGVWVDGETNWYTVTAFRHLADNVLASLRKGQRVVVTGRVRIRSWESGERSGMTVEVDADAIGHDLVWGRSIFERRVVSSTADRQGTTSGAGVVDPATAHDQGETAPGARPDGGGADDAPSDPSTTDASSSDAGGSATPAEAADWGAPPAVGADEVLAPF